MIAGAKPTITGAVPTIWNDVLRYAEKNPVDLSSLRFVLCGGSAVPRSLMEALRGALRRPDRPGLGHDRDQPARRARHRRPRARPPEEEMDWRAKTGRIVPGVELRIVDDAGTVLPWDGAAVGEIEVRGPWVTGVATTSTTTPEKFHDGWLRTGDVGTIDAAGFIQITDRAKDVIKSGGEWISSVELENQLMAHPDVDRGGGDRRARPALGRAAARLRRAAREREHPARRAARVPRPTASRAGGCRERWAFIEEVPKTSVGKFDKKVLRARYGEQKLEVVDLDAGAAGSQAAS